MKADFLMLLMVLSASALPSLARAEEAAPAAKPPPRMIYRKSEQQQFSGSKLKGQLKKPELSYIYQRKGLRAERIVNVPENFDEEIVSGAGQF